MSFRSLCIQIVVLAVFPYTVVPIPAIDWPQFMGTPQHNGDAGEEQLDLPLYLNAQIKLDDAVLSSPVIVGGRIYVVDQMGQAYGIDMKTGLIAWRCAPEGANTFGSNTSSPCVAKGNVLLPPGQWHVLLLRARVKPLETDKKYSHERSKR